MAWRINFLGIKHRIKQFAEEFKRKEQKVMKFRTFFKGGSKIKPTSSNIVYI